MAMETQIKQKAIEIGFDLIGITTADPIEPGQREYFEKWLGEGRAAGMAYLHRHQEKRFNPSSLLNGAKSVICVAVAYGRDNNRQSDYRIAAFAQYEDYHVAIKEGLFKLASFVQGLSADSVGFKACVDSVPLAERALAQRAGLGFIGRSRILINRDLGNRLLLGELITTLELEPDAPVSCITLCSDCGKCVQACPTGALEPGGDFDARKCISYLTIEEQGPNLPEAPGDTANYIYGCDECLNACPYARGVYAQHPLLVHHPEWQTASRQRFLDMSMPEFEAFFAHSGLLRLGLDRLKRNCRCR